MEKVKVIALITNFNIHDKACAALNVAEFAHKNGCRVLVADTVKEKIEKHAGIPEWMEFLPVNDIYKKAEVITVLGGDGSILEAARRSALTGTPILGINLGHLGYMTELESDDMKQLARLFSGDYGIAERSMLSISIVDSTGRVKFNSFALNDAVISNGSVARIVDVELKEGGESVTTYRADGIIIATPTGSTAYSMSAGGAIVDPRLSCICVTPICPHSLMARPLIFPDSALIEVKNICVREKNLFLTIDGRTNYELFRNESVRVTKSEKVTRLINLRERGFYDILRQKMGSNH